MVAIDPEKYDVLLVGPRVARLEPFFSQWGYRTTACEEGSGGLRALRESPFHLVVMELDLEDVESHTFVGRATALQPHAAFMLLDDPIKTGMIVSTFVQGVDVYLPTPPDEARLYEQVARHVLAAAARGGGTGDEQAQAHAEVERSRAALEHAGAKLRAATEESRVLKERMVELEAENERLTRELAAAERTGSKPQRGGAPGVETALISASGLALSEEELDELQSKAEFVSFLESENDSLKEELKALQSQLAAFGMSGAGLVDASDEEEATGEGDAVALDDDAEASSAAWDVPGTDPSTGEADDALGTGADDGGDPYALEDPDALDDLVDLDGLDDELAFSGEGEATDAARREVSRAVTASPADGAAATGGEEQALLAEAAFSVDDDAGGMAFVAEPPAADDQDRTAAVTVDVAALTYPRPGGPAPAAAEKSRPPPHESVDDDIDEAAVQAMLAELDDQEESFSEPPTTATPVTPAGGTPSKERSPPAFPAADPRRPEPAVPAEQAEPAELTAAGFELRAGAASEDELSALEVAILQASADAAGLESVADGGAVVPEAPPDLDEATRIGVELPPLAAGAEPTGPLPSDLGGIASVDGFDSFEEATMAHSLTSLSAVDLFGVSDDDEGALAPPSPRAPPSPPAAGPPSPRAGFDSVAPPPMEASFDDPTMAVDAAAYRTAALESTSQKTVAIEGIAAKARVPSGEGTEVRGGIARRAPRPTPMPTVRTERPSFDLEDDA